MYIARISIYVISGVLFFRFDEALIYATPGITSIDILVKDELLKSVLASKILWESFTHKVPQGIKLNFFWKLYFQIGSWKWGCWFTSKVKFGNSPTFLAMFIYFKIEQCCTVRFCLLLYIFITSLCIFQYSIIRYDTWYS